MNSRARDRLLAAAVLVLPLLILFWEVILAGRVLFWGVPLMQFVPWHGAAVQALRAGELPLWNPLVGNGAPLLANYQSALCYPPNWLYFLLAPAHALSWLMVLHVLWAGLGMWFYSRLIGLRTWPRLVSALSFMFSGYLVSRLGFPSIGSTLPWLPWTFWAAERLLGRRSLRSAAVLGLCLAMGWLAGHAQTAFYSGLALGAYVLWRILRPPSSAPYEPGERGRSVGRLLAYLLVAVAVGIGLAAIQLLPTAELQRLSQRASGVDYDYAMNYSLWPLRLIAFLTPRFFGHPATGNYWGYCCNYWEDNGYVGLLPSLLAAGALMGWLRARRARTALRSGADGFPLPLAESLVLFYAGLACLAVLLALGRHTPLYPFFHDHVPGFGLFQGPARLLCLWTMGVSVLAGIGAELWQPTGRIKKLARYGIVVGLGLLVAAGGSTQVLTGKTLTFAVGLLQLGLSSVLIGVLALSQPRPTEGRATLRWTLAVLLFVAADLVSANWGGNPTAEGWLYTRPTESAAALRAAGLNGRAYFPFADRERVAFGHYLSFATFSPAQERGWFGMRETLLPNMGMLDGLPSASNFDPLLPARYADLVEAVDAAEPSLRLKLLQMMGVETLITEKARPEPPPIYANADAAFSQVPDPLPRAYVVFSARWVDDSEDALQAITDPGFDPVSEVVLEGPPATTDVPSQWQPVTLTSSCNTVTIRAALPRDGYLVLLDTHYPGWQARVDGQLQTIFAANLAFRAVHLSAGEHVIEFRYRPVTFRTGAAVTGLTCLVLLGLLVSERALSRRRSQSPG
jgi:hypothetical protein